MIRRKLFIIMTVLLFTSQACGTIHVVSVDANRDRCYNNMKAKGCATEYGMGYSMYYLCAKTPNVYGGTVYKFRSITNPCIHTSGEAALAMMIFYLPINFLVSIIDLPMCVVADTVILPYTIYRQATVGNACDDYEKCRYCFKDKPFDAIFLGLDSGNVVRVTLQDKQEKIQKPYKLYGIDGPSENVLNNYIKYQDIYKDLRNEVLNVVPLYEDKSGYMVGMIYINNKISLQSLLLKYGIAWVDDSTCKKPICEEWRKIEDFAKLNRYGFWKDNLSYEEISRLDSIEDRSETKSDVQTIKDFHTGMEFVFVKGGCYQMGDPLNYKENKSFCGVCDSGFYNNSVCEVCVSDFYIGRYEVTQKQWKKIMGEITTWQSNYGDDYPVGNVDWFDAQKFISRLNAQTGKKYRLPTEAEWEYACRSGGMNEIYCGSNKLDSVAWYEDNSKRTHSVGLKKPNGLGIYDMSGNVCEWCQDWYGPLENATNPTGPSSGYRRITRGGTYCSLPKGCQATARGFNRPDNCSMIFGFRLASPIQQ